VIVLHELGCGVSKPKGAAGRAAAAAIAAFCSAVRGLAVDPPWWRRLCDVKLVLWSVCCGAARVAAGRSFVDG